MKDLSKSLMCMKPIVKQKTLQDIINSDYFNCNMKVLENDFELVNESMLQALNKVDNIKDYTIEKGAFYATSILGIKWFENVCKEAKLSAIFKIIKSLKRAYFYAIVYIDVESCIKNDLTKFLELFFDDLEMKFIVSSENINRKDVQTIDDNMLVNQIMQCDKFKIEFFANISHELRTPINIILSAIQLLELELEKEYSNIKKDKMITYVNNIKHNSYRLVKVINNLIDIAKIDFGYFQMNIQNSNIVSIVEDITLSAAEYIEFKNIEFIFDTEIEEKIIACDKEKIERIMLNLISNAIKFTPSGGTISVNIYDEGEDILISVKDTGIGISKDKQSNIFDKFIQVDKSLSRKREGSGIGLYIVKSLVKMQKGRVCCKSEIGKGSEFIVKLPAVALDNKECAFTRESFINQSNEELISIEFSDIYQ